MTYAKLLHHCRRNDLQDLGEFLTSRGLPRAPSDLMQQEGYLGNNRALLQHMIENGLQTMTTTAVQKWFQENDCFPSSYVAEGWEQQDCHIDHILPAHLAGPDHPYNYFVLPGRVNMVWNGWWTKHKRTYMGKANYKTFVQFVMWARAQAAVQFNEFSAISA